MYNVGIIGTGRIGFMLEDDPLRLKPCTHAGGIIKNKKLKITSACDINKKRLSIFAQKYNVDNLYTDYREMLKNESLDLVVIATWTDSHKEITIEAAKKGAKVIVCEKPMAFSSRDCRTMVNGCRKTNTILIINHERRYDPLYRKVREMIKENKIGKIRTILANVLTGCSYKGKSFIIDESSLMHDGTHLIDIALYLFGEPEKVIGFIPSDRKDTIYGMIEFKDEVMLFLEAGGDRKYFNFELDIQGTEGRLKIGNEYREFWGRAKSPRYSEFFELKKKRFPKIPDENHFIEEYREVVDILEHRKKRPASSGNDGMKAIKVIEKLTAV